MVNGELVYLVLFCFFLSLVNHLLLLPVTIDLTSIEYALSLSTYYTHIQYIDEITSCQYMYVLCKH